MAQSQHLQRSDEIYESIVGHSSNSFLSFGRVGFLTIYFSSGAMLITLCNLYCGLCYLSF